jgi:hypothetical protein
VTKPAPPTDPLLELIIDTAGFVFYKIEYERKYNNYYDSRNYIVFYNDVFIFEKLNRKR